MGTGHVISTTINASTGLCTTEDWIMYYPLMGEGLPGPQAGTRSSECNNAIRQD
jgi:hypothetical protein